MFKVEWTRIIKIQSTINLVLSCNHRIARIWLTKIDSILELAIVVVLAFLIASYICITYSKTPNSSSSVSCMNHNAIPKAIALGET